MPVISQSRFDKDRSRPVRLAAAWAAAKLANADHLADLRQTREACKDQPRVCRLLDLVGTPADTTSATP